MLVWYKIDLANLALQTLSAIFTTSYSTRAHEIIVNYSLIHLQFLRASDAKLA